MLQTLPNQPQNSLIVNKECVEGRHRKKKHPNNKKYFFLEDGNGYPTNDEACPYFSNSFTVDLSNEPKYRELINGTTGRSGNSQ